VEFYSFLRRRAQTDEGMGRGPTIWAGFFVLTFLAAILFKFPLLALLLPMAAVSLAMVWREPRLIDTMLPFGSILQVFKLPDCGTSTPLK